MPRERRRNDYQHVIDFDRGQIEAFRDCGLKYQNISARVGRDTMTVCRILNRWVQEYSTKCPAGCQSPTVTKSSEDRHLIRAALIDHSIISRALIQEMGSFLKQQVSPQAVR